MLFLNNCITSGLSFSSYQRSVLLWAKKYAPLPLGTSIASPFSVVNPSSQLGLVSLLSYMSEDGSAAKVKLNLCTVGGVQLELSPWLVPNPARNVYSTWDGVFSQQTSTLGHVPISGRGPSRRRRNSAVAYTLPVYFNLGRLTGFLASPNWVSPARLQGRLLIPRCKLSHSRTSAQNLDVGFFFPDSTLRHSKMLGYRQLRLLKKKPKPVLRWAQLGRAVFNTQLLGFSRKWGRVLSALSQRKEPLSMAVKNGLSPLQHRYYRGIRPRVFLQRRALKYARMPFLANRINRRTLRFVRRTRYTRFYKYRAHVRHRALSSHWHVNRWNSFLKGKLKLRAPNCHADESTADVLALRSSPGAAFPYLKKGLKDRFEISRAGVPLLMSSLGNKKFNATSSPDINSTLASVKPRAFSFYKRQPQVRYRPGFMTYWRVHRRAFAKALWLPFGHRQKRLTAYIARLRRIATFSYFRLLQLSLNKVILASRLIPQLSSLQAWHLVAGGAFAVNGVQARNPLHQVYATDYIQYLSFSELAKLRHPVVPMSRPWQTLYGIAKKRTVSDGGDAPGFIEVDELCLAVTILFEPYVDVFSTNRQLKTPVPFLTLKCYNWKYTT